VDTLGIIILTTIDSFVKADYPVHKTLALHFEDVQYADMVLMSLKLEVEFHSRVNCEGIIFACWVKLKLLLFFLII
jgi:hypothetical protein